MIRILLLGVNRNCNHKKEKHNNLMLILLFINNLPSNQLEHTKMDDNNIHLLFTLMQVRTAKYLSNKIQIINNNNNNNSVYQAMNLLNFRNIIHNIELILHNRNNEINLKIKESLKSTILLNPTLLLSYLLLKHKYYKKRH